ncbi:MAG TPA: protein phosphatase CheZ [Xanthobacteraceae bacterium]|nr:protein phosphatase CheZ [Xanthobacteraceae bacterium]
MSRRREVFRIEELGGMRASPLAAATPAEAALRHAEIMTELRTLQEAIDARGMPQAAPSLAAEAGARKSELGSIHDAVQRTKQEIATLVLTSVTNPEMGRVSQELNAVVRGTESATHRILQASEAIEEAAKTLAAAIHQIQDQNLARDILDQVTSIFEACNFQDLAGQRITKVTATLKFIEEHILKLMQIWGGIEQLADVGPAARAEVKKYPKLVNGPKLEGDPGCVSQNEIDAMFAPRAAR